MCERDWEPPSLPPLLFFELANSRLSPEVLLLLSSPFKTGESSKSLLDHLSGTERESLMSLSSMSVVAPRPFKKWEIPPSLVKQEQQLCTTDGSPSYYITDIQCHGSSFSPTPTTIYTCQHVGLPVKKDSLLLRNAGAAFAFSGPASFLLPSSTSLPMLTEMDETAEEEEEGGRSGGAARGKRACVRKRNDVAALRPRDRYQKPPEGGREGGKAAATDGKTNTAAADKCKSVYQAQKGSSLFIIPHLPSALLTLIHFVVLVSLPPSSSPESFSECERVVLSSPSRHRSIGRRNILLPSAQ